MGEWQILVCRNRSVPRLLQQRWESTEDMEVGTEEFQDRDSRMVELRGHGRRHTGTWGLWLQETDEL